MSEHGSIVMLTCYDQAFAKMICDTEAVDFLLVGDSLGMVIYGENSTAHIPLEWMIRHTQAVQRGCEQSKANSKPIVLADLPAQSYSTVSSAVKTAEAFREIGVQWLKLEGPCFEQVAELKSLGFRVVGHLGLTPQTASEFRLQAKSEAEAEKLLEEAQKLQDSGAEMIVLEMIPAPLAERVTKSLRIPTIGIGAGVHCSGQVLVLYDMLGFHPDFSPRFLRKFGEGVDFVQRAVRSYSKSVREKDYPSRQESFFLKDS